MSTIYHSNYSSIVLTQCSIIQLEYLKKVRQINNQLLFQASTLQLFQSLTFLILQSRHNSKHYGWFIFYDPPKFKQFVFQKQVIEFDFVSKEHQSSYVLQKCSAHFYQEPLEPYRDKLCSFCLDFWGNCGHNWLFFLSSDKNNFS